MAILTPVTATTAGTATPYVAASGGGDTIAVGLAGSRVLFSVRNASGSSITVTFAGSVLCSQGSTHNVAVVCAVGDTDIVVPAQSVNATTGNVAVTYSAVTSLTVVATV